MGRNLPFLVILILSASSLDCMAQSNFDVSEPRFELKNNKVIIYFDILGSSPSERFNIRIAITDSDGNRINARALEGDIGEKVSGGNDKLITWDLDADNIILNAEIIVNINAEIILPIPSTRDSQENNKLVGTSEFNRTGLFLQSLALPGIGLSRVTGKPHWIRGIAGYGCIAGSIVLNKMAVSSYDDFLIAETTEDSESFISKATQQDNISEVLAYAAISIWVTDFIWTMIGTRDINKKPLYSEAKGISFTTGYDPMTSSPLIGINFRF